MTSPVTDDFTNLDQLYEDAAGVHAAPEIAAAQQAEEHVRCYRYWCEQYEQVEQRFDEEIARLMGRSEQTLKQMERRQDWHRQALRQYYTQRGEKRLVLANATLTSQRRAGAR